MIRIRRTVVEGEMIPRFYGAAWFDHSRCVSVCFPLPLNWVAWAAREALYRLKQTPKTRYDKAYARGRRDAYLASRERVEEARREGYAKGAKEALQRLEEIL